VIVTGVGGFVACRALSQRNEDPTKASRPWDVVLLFSYCFFILYFVTCESIIIIFIVLLLY
jgi:hypothetical protein